MRKKISVLITLIIITLLGIIIILNNKNKPYEIINDNDGQFAFYYENDKGKYEISTESKWNTGEYILNLENTTCDGENNPSFLSWNDDNNSVTLTRNKATKCSLYFDIKTYDRTCDDNSLACYIAKKQGTNSNSKIIYHNNTIDVNNDGIIDDAGDLSYRYSGGDYVVTDMAKKNGYNSIYDIIVIHCGETEQSNDILCSSNVEISFTLKYDPTSTRYTNLKETVNKAIKDGYIKAENINNYVCIAKDENLCSNKGNLFRILGVFNNNGVYQVKLISADTLDNDKLTVSWLFDHNVYYFGTTAKNTTYKWNENADENSNNWQNSSLMKSLNSEYLNYLETLNSDIDNIISSTAWQNGGINDIYKSNRIIYDAELKNNSNPKYADAKIGLMYATDYTYSVDSMHWNEDFNKIARYDFWDNWMYMGVPEWTITPYSDSDYNKAYYFNYTGAGPISLTSNLSIRPTFYLNADVPYVSGTGTESDPYQIVEKAIDLSGNGYNGEFIGNVKIQKDDEGNYGLYFDGDESYVDIVDLPDTITWSDGFSYEFEAKWLSFNYFSRIIDFGNGAGVDNILFCNFETNNSVFPSVRYEGITYENNTAFTSFPLNQRIKIKVSYIKTNTGFKEIFYKDGQVIREQNYNVQNLVRNVNRNNNYLGKSNWSNDAYFNGYIYNIKFTDSNGNPILWYNFS